MAVTPVPAAPAPLAPTATKPVSTPGTTGGFGDALAEMLKSVESTGNDANDAVARMISGEGDVHAALIAVQHADTTFQLSVQVRNKLVQAYQDIMRMPV